MADYSMFRGNTFNLDFQVKDVNGNPKDITTAKLYFTVKRNMTEPDTEAVTQQSTTGGGVIKTVPLAGQGRATMPASATMVFADGPTVLEYDIKMIEADGTNTTCELGTITVNPSVTRAIS